QVEREAPERNRGVARLRAKEEDDRRRREERRDQPRQEDSPPPRPVGGRRPGVVDLCLLARDPRVSYVAETPPPPALEASREKAPHVPGRGGRQGREVHVLTQHRGKRVAGSLAREQTLPRQHLVQHHTERPDVRALVDRSPARLLG